MTTDFIIIGGGVIGLSIARELRRRGAGSVTVLERGLVGNEASHAAAGMLAPQAEADRADRFFEFCMRSGRAYPRLAEELLAETGIDIELDRTGTLYLAFDENDAAELESRRRWQADAGLDVSALTKEDVLSLEPSVSPETVGGLLFPNDGQVDNRKLIAALHASLRALGADVIEGCDVTGIIADSAGRVGGVRTRTTEHAAGTVVLATGAWTSRVDMPESRLEGFTPVKGEILALGPCRGLLKHVIYSPRGYVVPRSDGRILAGATTEEAGFDKSITVGAEKSIKESASEIVPRLDELEIREHVVGLRPLFGNGVPLIGAIPRLETVYVAAGHYRNGILLAPATAELVADLITAGDSEFGREFSPSSSGIE